jgi:hypothetical protein
MDNVICIRCRSSEFVCDCIEEMQRMDVRGRERLVILDRRLRPDELAIVCELGHMHRVRVPSLETPAPG